MFSLRTLPRRTPAPARVTSARLARPLSTSFRLSYAAKDSQDRQSINTESQENTKTGGDKAAAHSDAAFDPNTTRPEGEMSEAKGDTDSSVSGSGGNKHISKTKKEEESGSSQSAGPRGQSGERTSGGKSTGSKQ